MADRGADDGQSKAKKAKNNRGPKPSKIASPGTLRTAAAGQNPLVHIKPPRIGVGVPDLEWPQAKAPQVQPPTDEEDQPLGVVLSPEEEGEEVPLDEDQEDLELALEEDGGVEEVGAGQPSSQRSDNGEEDADQQPAPRTDQQRHPGERRNTEAPLNLLGHAAEKRRSWGRRPSSVFTRVVGRQLDQTPEVPSRAARRLSPSKDTKPAPYDATTIRSAAKALDFDLMKGAPRLGVDFDNSYTNPCWVNSAGQTKCLPAFYILGSFQSGAWNLYSCLAAHPSVLSKGINARPHFWGEHDKKMVAYADSYSSPSVLADLSADRSLIIGDASASTFAFYWAAGQRLHTAFREAMAPCWQNCTAGKPPEGKAQCMDQICFPAAQQADRDALQKAGISPRFAHLPLMMKAVYGKHTPRMIVVLRDPVERFHYAFWTHPHYRDHYGPTPEGFLKYARESVDEFHTCEDGSGPVRCALMFEALSQRAEEVFFHCDQLIRGIYAVFLEMWIAYFGREALLVVHAESYYEDPGTTLLDAVRHLGIQEPDPQLLQSMISAGERARQHHLKGRPEMLPEARSLLDEFYHPWNQRLSTTLRDKRFLWLQPGAKQASKLSRRPARLRPRSVSGSLAQP